VVAARVTEVLVSVVVATRNSERTLERCLASVRAQTHRDIELIVVDNRSSDRSVEIARRYTDRVSDAGPERCAQRNAGILASTGDFVLVVDSDMILEPGVVDACLTSCANCDAVAIDEVSFGDGFWARCKALERTFYRGDPTVSAARFFRRSALLAAGGYDPSLLAGEDWDLSMRVVGGNALAFASSVIRHDEGCLRLRALFLKKLYYGGTLPRFVRKHGIAGFRRVNPVRSSLIKNVGAMVRHPVLGAGIVTMKATELAAVVLGAVLSSRVSKETVYGR
jgi:glycosyltransferase involved in cell wall biosynthesis